MLATVTEMLLLNVSLHKLKYSLGHGLAVQPWVSLPLPSQSLPPSCGTGALQCRILVICPSPQVTEHDDHGDHKLHPPSWRTGHQKSDMSRSSQTHMCRVILQVSILVVTDMYNLPELGKKERKDHHIFYK